MPHQVADLPIDQLATIASRDTQRLAAKMAQDVFAEVFRLTLKGSFRELDDALSAVKKRCQNWCCAANKQDEKNLRLACRR